MKTVQVRKNVFLFLGALSFLTVLLGGCMKESTSSTPAVKTYLSLMHLAPRAPAIEVYFDNNKASSAINSGTVASAYSALDPNMFAINFKKAGSDSVVASIGTNLYDSSKYYTLLLYNYDSTHVSAVRIEDDFSVLTNDKAYIRFFHMSPDIADVDLYFDNNLVIPGRQYADNTTSNYWNQFAAISPSSVNVYVKKAGSDSVIAQSTSSVYLNQANAYTIFLKGIKGGTGTNALTVDVLQAAD
ncbi:MAG TPA: DUF4397 domain-containing protein [Niastella sp.]